LFLLELLKFITLQLAAVAVEEAAILATLATIMAAAAQAAEAE
jgi:hypothetical protein